MANKQAVVFILDASPSMNQIYPPQQQNVTVDHETGSFRRRKDRSSMLSTRLSCAKEAITTMVSDLMIQSKTNEVCVIVCKTQRTKHHMLAQSMDVDNNNNNNDGDDDDDDAEIPFPNLTELSNGVTFPSVELLKRIQEIETISMEEANSVQGDFCKALFLAADALQQRTGNRKYKRKIVLLTDAGYEVAMDATQVLTVIDSLRSMECSLHVIGMDFEATSSTLFDQRAAAPSSNNDDRDLLMEEEEEEGSEDENDDHGMIHYASKKDREALLLSLTEKLGGEVVAASSMKQILDSARGKKTVRPSRRRFEFRLAPGIAFEAFAIVIMKVTGYESLKKEVVLVDEGGDPMYNGLGEERTDKLRRVAVFVDEEEPDDPIDSGDITTAIQYGSTPIVMTRADIEQAEKGNDYKESPAHLQVLGYMAEKKVPELYRMGPPSMISGGDSFRARMMIAALAQALERLQRIALCTFQKTASNSKDFGALFPMKENNLEQPVRLLFIKLPYGGDVKSLDLGDFDQYLHEDSYDYATRSRVCDDLVDKLMLPDDTILKSGKVPSPFHRSWNQTKVQRAIDPKADVVQVRHKEDLMKTPEQVLQRAQASLEAFHDTFEFTKKRPTRPRQKQQNGRRGKKVLHFRDFLES